jgi:hypothetical protein
MGSSTKPTSNAVALTTDARLRQGMPRQDEIEMAARRTGG